MSVPDALLLWLAFIVSTLGLIAWYLIQAPVEQVDSLDDEDEMAA